MKEPQPKPSLRTLAEKLSQTLYFDAASYRFKAKKSPYDEGMLQAIDWMEEICLHYLREDERMKREMTGLLEETLIRIRRAKKTPKNRAMDDAVAKALADLKRWTRTEKK